MRASNAARRAATAGVMASLALIFGYVETLIPFNFGIPGVKLGLANLIVVVALYRQNAREAFLICAVKIAASSLLFGNPASFLYALSGGLVSFAAMALLRKTGKFGIVGVSALGGAFHNIGQLAVAIAVLETARLAYYLPALLAFGVGAGVLIGIIADRSVKLLSRLGGEGGR